MAPEFHAVSYTHLDVYKRQGLFGGDGQLRGLPARKPRRELVHRTIQPRQQGGGGGLTSGKIGIGSIDSGRQRLRLKEAEQRAQLMFDDQCVTIAAARCRQQDRFSGKG